MEYSSELKLIYIIYIVYHDIQNTSKYFNLENFYKSFLSVQKRPFFSDVGPLSQLLPALRDFTGQIQSNLQTFQTETIRGEADIEKIKKKYIYFKKSLCCAWLLALLCCVPQGLFFDIRTDLISGRVACIIISHC